MHYITILITIIIQAVNAYIYRRPPILSTSLSLSNSIPIYDGPKMVDFESIEAQVIVDDLNIQILVGASTVCNGRGLFIALDENVEEVTIPRGTPVCGYSKGTFISSAEGDKTVAYLFEDINVAVFFNKELIPLKKAISIVANKRDILIDAVKDHSLYYDDELEEIIIVPNLENATNYFVPDVNDNWSLGRMGIYANDLAYEPNISEDEYNRSVKEKNLLQLVWRMDVQDDVLIPTWPVVIVNKDIKIRCKEPMEIGVSYSFRYWKAATAALNSSAFASNQ